MNKSPNWNELMVPAWLRKQKAKQAEERAVAEAEASARRIATEEQSARALVSSPSHPPVAGAIELALESMSNPFEICIKSSKELERLLEERLGAHGKGLHEKIDSVRGRLSHSTISKLRMIATVRNRLIHEVDYELGIPALEMHRTKCIDAIRALRAELADLR